MTRQNDALACAGWSFSKLSSRLRGVSVFTIARKKPHFGEPPGSLDDLLSTHDAALACAGRALLLKMLVSPRRCANTSIRTSFGPWTVKRIIDLHRRVTLSRALDSLAVSAQPGRLRTPKPSPHSQAVSALPDRLLAAKLLTARPRPHSQAASAHPGRLLTARPSSHCQAVSSQPGRLRTPRPPFHSQALRTARPPSHS